MRLCRSVFLRGRIWWGKYKIPFGKIIRISLDTDNKHVAEKKLLDIYTEAEQELYGLIPSKILRKSAERPLREHLDEYLENLLSLGRNGKYVSDTGSRVERIMKDCGWTRIRDVSADGFGLWRSRRRKMSPSTLNAHLGAMCSFFAWMVAMGRAAGNPLTHVGHVETRGRERVVRRALLVEELRRLVSIGEGHRGLVYFMAAYTGLRRREIRLLRWSDVSLDSEHPFVRARASTAKNKRSAVIPLHPALVSALRDFQRTQSDLSGSVFPTMPTAKTVNQDFEKLCIRKTDTDGRKVDFHALRVTFATLLNLQGVGPRSAMELMRHSDMRLTHKVYTDTSVLPLAVEVGKLPTL